VYLTNSASHSMASFSPSSAGWPGTATASVLANRHGRSCSICSCSLSAPAMADAPHASGAAVLLATNSMGRSGRSATSGCRSIMSSSSLTTANRIWSVLSTTNTMASHWPYIDSHMLRYPSRPDMSLAVNLTLLTATVHTKRTTDESGDIGTSYKILF